MQSNKSEWEKSQTGPCPCRTLGSCFTLSGRGFVRGGALGDPRLGVSETGQLLQLLAPLSCVCLELGG